MLSMRAHVMLLLQKVGFLTDAHASKRTSFGFHEGKLWDMVNRVAHKGNRFF